MHHDARLMMGESSAPRSGKPELAMPPCPCCEDKMKTRASSSPAQSETSLGRITTAPIDMVACLKLSQGRTRMKPSHCHRACVPLPDVTVAWVILSSELIHLHRPPRHFTQTQVPRGKDNSQCRVIGADQPAREPIHLVVLIGNQDTVPRIIGRPPA